MRLFFGDEYLVKAAARDFCADLTGPNQEKAALVVLDGASLDFGNLVSEVYTPSLFCSHKVICVDQTSIFVGKSNFDKLVSRVCESWRSGEKSASIRSFSQLVAAANVDAQGSNIEISELEDALGTSFSEKDKQTIVEVASAFCEDRPVLRGSNDESVIIDLISSPLPDGVTLIFTASSVDKKKKLYKLLEKHGQVTEYAPVREKYSSGLQKNYFRKLVEEYLSNRGKTISADALNKMYERSGKDIRQIHSELEKMIAFAGDHKQITVEAIEELFVDFHEPMFFDFLTALRTADPKKCLLALHDNLKLVAHPLQTLSAITSEFRKIIAARELLFSDLKKDWRTNMGYDQFSSIMKKVRSSRVPVGKKSKSDPMSMNDYPLYLTLKTAQNYTMEQLTMIMEAILDAEITIKSTRVGSVSPDSVIQDLTLKICHLGSGKSRM